MGCYKFLSKYKSANRFKYTSINWACINLYNIFNKYIFSSPSIAHYDRQHVEWAKPVFFGDLKIDLKGNTIFCSHFNIWCGHTRTLHPQLPVQLIAFNFNALMGGQNMKMENTNWLALVSMIEKNNRLYFNVFGVSMPCIVVARLVNRRFVVTQCSTKRKKIWNDFDRQFFFLQMYKMCFGFVYNWH